MQAFRNGSHGRSGRRGDFEWNVVLCAKGEPKELLFDKSVDGGRKRGGEVMLVMVGISRQWSIPVLDARARV